MLINGDSTTESIFSERVIKAFMVGFIFALVINTTLFKEAGIDKLYLVALPFLSAYCTYKWQIRSIYFMVALNIFLFFTGIFFAMYTATCPPGSISRRCWSDNFRVL